MSRTASRPRPRQAGSRGVALLLLVAAPVAVSGWFVHQGDEVAEAMRVGVPWGLVLGVLLALVTWPSAKRRTSRREERRPVRRSRRASQTRQRSRRRR